MDLTPFEQECVAMIEKLETVNLPRATTRLLAAERAVKRAQEEIAAFQKAIEIHREMHAPLEPTP